MSDAVSVASLAELNPRTERPKDPNAEVSFIPMADVSESGRWTARQTRRYRDVQAGYTAFREGDVLFAKITPCMENGKGALVTGLAGGLGFGSTEFHVLRAIPGRCEPDFLAQVLTLPLLRQRAESFFTGSAGQRRVPERFFEHFFIPAYTPEEQRRIADLLSAVDEHIRLLAAESEKEALRVQALLQAVLPAGFAVENPPENFLADALLGIEAGKSFMCSDAPALEGEWGVLKVSSVRPDGFVSSENKQVEDLSLVNARYEVVEGDLLMTRANTPELVGAACYVVAPQRRLLLCDKTLRLRPRPQVLPQYLWLWLQTPVARRHVDAHATGTSAGMKNISQGAIRRLPLYLPSPEEQQQVVRPIVALQEHIFKLRLTAEKLRKLKSGLAAKLLNKRT